MAKRASNAVAKVAIAKVVSAMGTSSATQAEEGLWSSRELDEVMADAVIEGMKEGVALDDPQMRSRMLKARDEYQSVRKTVAMGRNPP